ncbi:MAG TPA: hypothetical protein VG248_17470 [Caulobacteraceae bacterium]|nr:hypothetical protein [Caulobacteraceae bacterium]
MSERPSYPRIPCSIPFCRRGTTIYEPGYEIICGKHWRLADRALRRLHSRAVRLGRNRLAHLLWARRIKPQIIERAAGASA